MAKRILVVSYHFYPHAVVGAKRMSELVRYLCKEGHEVVVVAAKPAHHDKVDTTLQLNAPNLRHIWVPKPPKLLPPLLRWLKRLRVGTKKHEADPVVVKNDPAPSAGRLSRLKRAYFSMEWLVDDSKLWSVLTAGRLLGLAFSGSFDAVISSGPPMSPHLAVRLAKPALRGRWLMDMRDPWCDQDQHPELQTGFSRWLNQRLQNLALAAADVVTVTTPGYQQVLQRRYPDRHDQIQLVLNGFDDEKPLTPPPRGSLNLLYAGSLYYNRDPFPLLRAVRDLVQRPDVERERVSVRFVGNCKTWNGLSLSDWVQANQLEDCVQIESAVPAAEVYSLLAEANVLLNFAQGQPLQIPAKMFDYLAAQRELLVITEPDSDTAWLARQASFGRIVAPGDDAALEAALANLYADYAQGFQVSGPMRVGVGRFSRYAQCERFSELLQRANAVEQEASL